MAVEAAGIANPDERDLLARGNKASAVMETIDGRHADAAPRATIVALEVNMSDDYPLSILDHRITTLRDRLHALSQELYQAHGDQRAKLADRLAALSKEIDELVAERDILASDAR